MKGILKYYKPYLAVILLLLIIGFLRAFGTLYLPSFSEKIIDVGLTRDGIGEVPIVISDYIYGFLDEYGVDSDLYVSYSEYEGEKNFENFSGDLNGAYVLKDDAKINENFQDSLLTLFFEKTLSGEITLPEEYQSMITSETSLEDFSLEDIPSTIKDILTLEFIKSEYGMFGYDVNQGRTDYLLREGSEMVLVAFFILFMVVATSLCSSYVSSRTSRDIRKAIYDKTLSFSKKELEQFSTASLITRTTNDVVQITNTTNMVFQIALYAPILGIWGIYKTYTTAANLILVNAFSVIAIVIIFFVLMRVSFPRFKVIQKLIDKMNLVTREMLSGILVIRAFDKETKMEEKFDEVNQEVKNNNLFVGYILSSIFPIISVVMNLTILAVVYFGAINVQNGNMQLGSIFAVMQYSINILMAFMMLSMLSFQLPRAFVSAGRISEVLDTKPSIKDGLVKDFENIGKVEFKNVTFKHNQSEEVENALANVTFTAKPQQVTAIIGSTGSGKSTIVNLIQRFYDVTDGEILVDNVNVKDYKISDLRHKIAVVAQKSFLFSGTIGSTIKYAHDVTDERLMEIAEIAESKDFIMEKEGGFDAPIHQGGKNVSGGQRQRLSIARALTKGAKILVFDDSFSALDYKTDFNLRKNIKEKMNDVTVIIVAQRVSTIKDADSIICLDSGKIVGQGTHSELLESCIVYKEIVDSQLKKGGEF